jgi:hypothetical protein
LLFLFCPIIIEPPVENFRAPKPLRAISDKVLQVSLKRASGKNGPISHYKLIVVPKDLYAKATKPQHIKEEDVSFVDWEVFL